MPQFSKIKVVCFGGGTGLPSLLTGLKKNPWFEITAVVNMFDSGGSSGELKDRFGILPPGDILKCLLALSEHEVAARKILLKRIQNERMPGHTGGNVLLMALENVYGDYLSAVGALGQILSIKGSVVPVTLGHAALCASYADGSVQKGETQVDSGLGDGKEITRLFLEPAVQASPDALRAIGEADVLCIGPGSFYTSVLPNFLPVGIREAIAASSAPAIFICNLLTEGAGMRGFDIPKLVRIVEEAIGRPLTRIIANKSRPQASVLERYAQEHKHPILADEAALSDERVLAADLWLEPSIARHDPASPANLVFAAIP